MQFCFVHEPQHDKTNKMSVRPAKTQISLDIPLQKVTFLIATVLTPNSQLPSL